MASCELCGASNAEAVVDVEGSELRVCGKCAGFGAVKKKLVSESVKSVSKSGVSVSMPEESVVMNAGRLIRESREKLGLGVIDFARVVGEKESVVRSVESGRLVPAIDVAKKFEKVLGIKLVEFELSDDFVVGKSADAPMTLGDLIKKKTS